jgi:hypothetical protein
MLWSAIAALAPGIAATTANGLSAPFRPVAVIHPVDMASGAEGEIYRLGWIAPDLRHVAGQALGDGREDAGDMNVELVLCSPVLRIDRQRHLGSGLTDKPLSFLPPVFPEIDHR